MSVISIGLRELQRETSRVVRDVETNGTTYRVQIQGRPTAVQLSKGPERESGATLEELRSAPWYRNKSPELLAAQLDELERSRDAVGYVGQPR